MDQVVTLLDGLLNLNDIGLGLDGDGHVAVRVASGPGQLPWTGLTTTPRGKWYSNPSSLIRNLTSQLPMMFWILNLKNLASKVSFCMMCAYFHDANLESSSDLAPVMTTLPEVNMSAVVFRSRMHMMMAAKHYTWGQRQRMFGN